MCIENSERKGKEFMRMQRMILFLVFIVLLVGVSLILLPRLHTNAAARVVSPQTESERITIDEFKALLAKPEPVVIIDVRGEAAKKIKGALHIPLPELESRLSEIPRDREIVTYCA